MLALFCNPRVPQRLQLAHGLLPLALGQEIKHLLKSLSLADVAIEPAATLADAQAALQRHQPRILAFSGHTFGGRLAFENERGQLDMEADPEQFVKIITGQALPQPTRLTLAGKPGWFNGKALPKSRQPGELAGFRPLMGASEHDKKQLHEQSLKKTHKVVRNLKSKEEAIAYLQRMTNSDHLDKLGLKLLAADRASDAPAQASEEPRSPTSSPRRGHRRKPSRGEGSIPTLGFWHRHHEALQSSPVVSQKSPGPKIQAAVDDLQLELASTSSEWKHLATWGGFRRAHAKKLLDDNGDLGSEQQRRSRGNKGKRSETKGDVKGDGRGDGKFSSKGDVKGDVKGDETGGGSSDGKGDGRSKGSGGDESPNTPTAYRHSPSQPHQCSSTQLWSSKSRAGVRPSKPPLPPKLLRRLESVFLCGCNTVEFAYHLLRAAPTLEVICWTTIVEDSAARTFSTGFYASIADPVKPASRNRCARCPGSRRREKGNPPSRNEVAFWAGCKAFTEAGFGFGDPSEYLHRVGHPHRTRPEFNTCQGCTPPVQGMPVLLRMVGSEIVRTSPKALSQCFASETEQLPGPIKQLAGSAKNLLVGIPEAMATLAVEVGLTRSTEANHRPDEIIAREAASVADTSQQQHSFQVSRTTVDAV